MTGTSRAVRRERRRWGLLVCVLGLALPGPAAAGTLSVLTYNVAGLPFGLSSSSPEVNTSQISPRLNAYDLAVVQEDFGFHDELVAQTVHPWVTEKDTTDVPFVQQTFDPPLQIGDGLNTFSFSPFTGFTRVTWSECFGLFDHGSDCLAPKGFTFARHEIAPGVEIDVYDLHADAGSAPEDLAARRSNIRQLAAAIVALSQDRALIVLGDTNSRYTREGDVLPELLATTGLTDVWVELARGGSIPALGPSLTDGCAQDLAGPDCERVDKIFYRSGGGVELTALDLTVPGDWVDAQGVQLSDHWPVSARFAVRAVPEPSSAFLLLGALAGLTARRRGRGPRARRDSARETAPGHAPS